MAKKDKTEKLEEIIEEAKEEGVEVKVVVASDVVESIPSGFEPPRKRR